MYYSKCFVLLAARMSRITVHANLSITLNVYGYILKGSMGAIQ
jgi:hypothetical protein